MPDGNVTNAPVWDEAFCTRLQSLMEWRRDVRHFRPDAVPGAIVAELIAQACLAPSVGNAQPWRFVTVDDLERRARIIASFEQCNAAAADGYKQDRQSQYRSLKLAGLREAPVHLAVFCDELPQEGDGLGRQTMPEMLRYSVVCAVHTLWLAARAIGLGVGWVSILNPSDVRSVLEMPENYTLIAYLCIGWPREDHISPELQRRGWQDRQQAESKIIRR